MKAAVYALLLCLCSPAIANDWQTIRNCRLMENESNDGDSFHVKADGEERIFRLYFVDTPETEDNGRMADRIAEQAERPIRRLELTADHIIPRAVAPLLDKLLANLDLMRHSLNIRKGAKGPGSGKSIWRINYKPPDCSHR